MPSRGQDMARTRSRAPEMLISPLWEYNKDEIAGYSRVAPNIEQWSFISTPPRRRSLSPSSSTPSSLLSQRLKRGARRTFALMIKRMASKLHLGHSKNVPADSASSSSAASSYTASSAQSVSTLSLSHEHRASISTERTSLHEWVKSQSDAMQQDRSEIEVRRSKGSYRLSDFIIQRTLGTGSFGRVHLVRSKHNLRFYAIKVLNKEKIVRMKQESHTRNEQMMLQAVQHPFIINLWGTFQDTANLYMVMDFVPGGELFTLLRRSNRFPDPVAKFYAAEVALALNYLHSNDIIYRDLKPENILLNFDGHIKIADFGFAKYCNTTAWTLCGTPDYLAPEIIGNARYNKSVDWYALGVLIFEMLSGLPPFHEPDISPVVLYEKIAQGPSCIKWPAFHPNATDLILKFMERDPSKRFGNLQHGAGDVFAHPWFREVDWKKLLNREITAPYLPRIAGDGDASAFERYPEDNAAAQYGEPTPDPYGNRFPDFEYTSS